MKKTSVCEIKRNTAGIMAAMMLIVMLFSTFFIALHADHDHDDHCPHEDCPVCVCMQMCENTVRLAGTGIVAVTVSLLLHTFLLSMSLPEISLLWSTPVSQKVRLNN